MKQFFKKMFLNRGLPAFMVMNLVVLSCILPVHAQSYTYSRWGKPVAAPDAYEWVKSIRGKDVNIASFDGITDLYARNGKLFIAMNDRVIVTDEDFHTLLTIEEYETNEGTKSISAPTCVFVTQKGHIYVAEEAQGLILEFDEHGKWLRTLSNPQITGLGSIKYAPTKVVVDENDRIYVKAKSVYEGIIELDPDGNYTRFVGANEVVPNILERFYRKIATEEQISRMALWLPTDYSDIALDKDGFLMATVKDNKSENPIRKLNSKGTDIMPEYEYLETAKGDFKGHTSISQLTTIATSEDGRFAALDSIRNRIFVYASDGLLVYTLGGTGKQEGALNSPVDVCFMGDKILVADLVSKTIEVFEPTVYGAAINAALQAQGEYDYETAAKYWQQVYDSNPNLVSANMGLGKRALRAGNYAEAMSYFKACSERESYSAAYERVREAWLNKHLGTVFLGVICMIIGIILIKRLLRVLNGKESFRNSKFVTLCRKIRYEAFTWPGYVLSHPFKAFDDIKYENAGNTGFCVIIFILFAWANLFKTKYAGFLVNTNNTDKINVPLVLISCLLPYIIFVIGNWAVGTLIDGKGSLQNVFKMTAYAMYPTVWLYVIGTILSQGIIYEEKMLVQFLFVLPMVLFVFYCFVGIVMVHQFSFSKGLVSVLLSIVAMAIILFIIVLLTTLVSGFINDTMTIWDEFSLYYL